MKKPYVQAATLGFEISGYIVASLILGDIIATHIPSTKEWITLVLILCGFMGWVARVIQVTKKP